MQILTFQRQVIIQYVCVFQPENILMAEQKSDHIRICDFGNALKVNPNEELYCKYGTPEFIAPEIVNQSPISKSTDIW